MQREDRNAASVGARMRQEAISRWENEGGSVAGWFLPRRAGQSSAKSGTPKRATIAVASSRPSAP